MSEYLFSSLCPDLVFGNTSQVSNYGASLTSFKCFGSIALYLEELFKLFIIIYLFFIPLLLAVLTLLLSILKYLKSCFSYDNFKTFVLYII